jgi:hypothetical protein
MTTDRDFDSTAYGRGYKDGKRDAATEITRLKAEVERLRNMVRRAYNDGFGEGIKEHTTHKGGNPWHMSKWPAALAQEKKAAELGITLENPATALTPSRKPRS